MFSKIKNPWPGNLEETIAFSIEDCDKNMIKYYVRIAGENFEGTRYDLIELRNRINGAIRKIEYAPHGVISKID